MINLHDNLNLHHQSKCTITFKKLQRMGSTLFSLEKPYINFFSRKYYALALKHKVYNKDCNHQLQSNLYITITFGSIKT